MASLSVLFADMRCAVYLPYSCVSGSNVKINLRIPLFSLTLADVNKHEDIMRISTNPERSVLLLTNVFSKIKSQLADAAACNMSNTDWYKYAEAVKASGDFDGDSMYYEATQRMQFREFVCGFWVGFEADVWGGSDNYEATVENIEINDYLCTI